MSRSTGWKLVKLSDLPVLSEAQLQEVRAQWVKKSVWFFDRREGWKSLLVFSISSRGLVKVAFQSDGAWVYRTIMLDAIESRLKHDRSHG